MQAGLMQGMGTSFSGGALRRPENLMTMKARVFFALSSRDARVKPEHDGALP
jgi:hypothetical protein